MFLSHKKTADTVLTLFCFTLQQVHFSQVMRSTGFTSGSFFHFWSFSTVRV